ncbi:MAG: hypothetical protein LBQ88_13345 [Treponema sp.]|nr:hypothetical protein [Treponema sp.]
MKHTKYSSPQTFSGFTFKKFNRERREKDTKKQSTLLPSTAKIPKLEEI